MFFLSDEAKIARLKDNLQRDLEAILQEKRNDYLHTLSKIYISASSGNLEVGETAACNERIVCDTVAMLGIPELNYFINTSVQDTLKRHPLLQSKLYFSWLALEPLGNPNVDVWKLLNNRKAQFEHYRELDQLAKQFNSASSHVEIKGLAMKIRDLNTTVFSSDQRVTDSTNISISKFPSSGRNIVLDLLFGFYGTLGAALALSMGIIFAIPAGLMGSQYFGTASFMLDSTAWLAESLCLTLAAIVFPIALLYSKATTNSYDVVSKGHILRKVDSLIALCNDDGVSNQAPTALEMRIRN